MRHALRLHARPMGIARGHHGGLLLFGAGRGRETCVRERGSIASSGGRDNVSGALRTLGDGRGGCHANLGAVANERMRQRTASRARRVMEDWSCSATGRRVLRERSDDQMRNNAQRAEEGAMDDGG